LWELLDQHEESFFVVEFLRTHETPCSWTQSKKDPAEKLKRANGSRSQEHKRLEWEDEDHHEDRHRFKLERNCIVQDANPEARNPD
jgi:hypothetical protein